MYSLNCPCQFQRMRISGDPTGTFRRALWGVICRVMPASHARVQNARQRLAHICMEIGPLLRASHKRGGGVLQACCHLGRPAEGGDGPRAAAWPGQLRPGMAHPLRHALLGQRSQPRGCWDCPDCPPPPGWYDRGEHIMQMRTCHADATTVMSRVQCSLARVVLLR